MIDILFSAFLLSVVLLGIHSYYGLHIIERGIIFTDLGIGQMAAFGAAIAILVFDGHYMYPVSLAFSLLGALLIALSTKRTRNHEAFIGLLYAFGMSAAVVALSRAPRGAEEMQHLVAADILFVPMAAVFKTAGLNAVIGVVLFFTMSRLRGTVKELVFFGTFSLTVTSSVNLAGVLVVFAILVAPAFIMSSTNLSFRAKLLGAWGLGTVLNLIAITASYFLDLPTGYTVVALYAFSGVALTLMRGVGRSEEGRKDVGPRQPTIESPRLDQVACRNHDGSPALDGGGLRSRLGQSSLCSRPPRRDGSGLLLDALARLELVHVRTSRSGELVEVSAPDGADPEAWAKRVAESLRKAGFRAEPSLAVAGREASGRVYSPSHT